MQISIVYWFAFRRFPAARHRMAGSLAGDRRKSSFGRIAVATADAKLYIF